MKNNETFYYKITNKHNVVLYVHYVILKKLPLEVSIVVDLRTLGRNTRGQVSYDKILGESAS